MRLQVFSWRKNETGKFRVSEEMYALLAGEADRVNQTPSAYAKQKIEYHLTGGNAQIDRLSSSIEQLTHRVYVSHSEIDQRGKL